MIILPLNPAISKKIAKHNLNTKATKQLSLFSSNPSHPSLNIELLEPKEYSIYSFRIDRKYRALFIYRKQEQAIEILNITVHYK